MLNVRTNINDVIAGLQKNIMAITSTSEIPRGVATSLLPIVKTRIHEDGLDADGKPIGKYSEGYMAVRTGLFQSNDKYKSGKNKGKQKPSGVFTKGKDKGAPRPNYNRTSDPTVIISLTRQLENDFKVVSTASGNYGLGFINQHNFDKSQWVEKTYGKKIFALTDEEKTKASEVAQSIANEMLQRI